VSCTKLQVTHLENMWTPNWSIALHSFWNNVLVTAGTAPCADFTWLHELLFQ